MGGSCTVRISGTFERADQAVHDSEPSCTIKQHILRVKMSIVDNPLLEHEGWGEIHSHMFCPTSRAGSSQ